MSVACECTKQGERRAEESRRDFVTSHFQPVTAETKTNRSQFVCEIEEPQVRIHVQMCVEAEPQTRRSHVKRAIKVRRVCGHLEVSERYWVVLGLVDHYLSSRAYLPVSLDWALTCA